MSIGMNKGQQKSNGNVLEIRRIYKQLYKEEPAAFSFEGLGVL